MHCFRKYSKRSKRKFDNKNEESTISINIDIVSFDKYMKPKCCVEKKSVTDLSQTVEFLKIISEENRLKILCLLREGEKCVCEMWQYLHIAQNLTSHHLKVLKNFGLVSSRQEGLKVIYSINKKIIKKYSKLLHNYLNSYGE